MQGRFDFGAGDLERWRVHLAPLIAGEERRPPRPPDRELVKALISSRTRDAVSREAYERLMTAYPTTERLAAAASPDVERLIGAVTHADRKARQLVGGLATMRREGVDPRLTFLARWPLARALGWLERFPGVGRKVAASVLNASTLRRPVFIADTHIVRALRRLGFVAPTAGYRIASETVTAAAPGWSGDAFLAFHDALKRLGQRVCVWDVPRCADCPLVGDCPRIGCAP